MNDIERVLEIVGEAVDLHGAEREAYLDSVCGKGTPLRREVVKYLQYEFAGGLLGDGPDEAPEIEVELDEDD